MPDTISGMPQLNRRKREVEQDKAFHPDEMKEKNRFHPQYDLADLWDRLDSPSGTATTEEDLDRMVSVIRKCHKKWRGFRWRI